MTEVVFESSGSTGAPKRIVRTEESLQEDARAIRDFFSELWSPPPPVVASVRADHMYGALWRVRVPRLAGSVVDESLVFSVEELLALRQKFGAFLFVTTPSFLEKALLHPDFDLLKGAFRGIVTSGSLLRDETSQAILSRVGVSPLEIYGSTEAGTVAFRVRSRGEAWTLVDRVSARALDDGRLEVVSPFASGGRWTMDDLVTFTGERTFLLQGRADRRVKILESFVSLASVEEVVRSHEAVGEVRVEPFEQDGVVRLGALVVPSATGIDRLSRDGADKVAHDVRAFLLKRLPSVSTPRRIRFVRALPVNAQGKTTRRATQDALSLWCREPVVREWEAQGERLVAHLVFPADMECFRGHFPGFPVLPGVAQLYFLHHFAKQAFPDFPTTPTYRRLKFQKVVLPFVPVTLELTRQKPGCFSFSFSNPHGACSSGLVEGS